MNNYSKCEICDLFNYSFLGVSWAGMLRRNPPYSSSCGPAQSTKPSHATLNVTADTSKDFLMAQITRYLLKIVIASWEKISEESSVIPGAESVGFRASPIIPN
jgi:hypothetical protein